MGCHEQISPFSLEGRFLGFAAQKSYKLHYLRLATATGEQIIKLPKEQRLELYRQLTPGDWIQVSGIRKLNYQKGTLKLKASDIVSHRQNVPAVNVPAIADRPSAVNPSPAASQGGKKPTTILVCQKSDCCKRGGRALVQALQQEVSDRGLDDRVTIKGTGCMKQCKAGPNLVMPDKTRHCRIQAADVPHLLDQHLPTPVAVH